MRWELPEVKLIKPVTASHHSATSGEWAVASHQMAGANPDQIGEWIYPSVMTGRFPEPSERIALLIGNGASIAVDRSFRYDYLYDKVGNSRVRAAFAVIGTTNFETALRRLQKLARRAMKSGEPEVIRREQASLEGELRASLGDAILHVHPAYSAVSDVLGFRGKQFGAYETVYTTNYDLLTYWSFMAALDGYQKFVDGFFSHQGGGVIAFDEDTFVRAQGVADTTRIAYLHGAIHLARTESRTVKLLANDDQGLMTIARGRDDLLLVTEGRSREKRKAIADNDYLRFVFKQFDRDATSLVILGFSFSRQDRHIIEALKESERDLYIGLWGATPERLVEERRRVEDLLERNASYFDASTHPLISLATTPPRGYHAHEWPVV